VREMGFEPTNPLRDKSLSLTPLAKLGDSRFGVKWFHSTNLNIMELGISGHFYSISGSFTH
jgi:hypothetical protein